MPLSIEASKRLAFSEHKIGLYANCIEGTRIMQDYLFAGFTPSAVCLDLLDKVKPIFKNC